MGTYKSRYSGVEIDQILKNSREDHTTVADNRDRISSLNSTLVDTRKGLQSQINTLVLESGGDSNLEVVSARFGIDSHMHRTLGERLEADFDKKLNKSVFDAIFTIVE